MYSYVFCKEVVHSLINIETLTDETMLMFAIGIVDVSMVLNLIIVCVIGGWRIQRANALRRKVIKSFRKNTQKEYKNLIFLLVED